MYNDQVLRQNWVWYLWLNHYYCSQNSVLCQYMALRFPPDIHSQSIKRHLYEKRKKNSAALIVSSCLSHFLLFSPKEAIRLHKVSLKRCSWCSSETFSMSLSLIYIKQWLSLYGGEYVWHMQDVSGKTIEKYILTHKRSARSQAKRCKCTLYYILAGNLMNVFFVFFAFVSMSVMSIVLMSWKGKQYLTDEALVYCLC